jgi:hypothetical protein
MMEDLKSMKTKVDGKMTEVYIHLENENGYIVGNGKSKRKLWHVPKTKKQKN